MRYIFYVLGLLIFLTLNAQASKPVLLSPYMVSLKAKRAFVRTGPGKCYPVKWTLVYPSTPLKIIESFDVWRHIEDPLGGHGWIHKSLVWRKPFLYITHDTYLRRRPKPSATAYAKIEKGAFVLLKSTHKDWFYVDANGFRGYVPQKSCWKASFYAPSNS